MKSILCFIGDGANGLLGYVTALESAHENGLQCARLAESLVQGENLRRILQSELIHMRDSFMGIYNQDRQRYELHVAEIQSRAHEVELQHQLQLRALRANVAGHIADKRRHQDEASAEIKSLLARGAEEVMRLHTNYKSHIVDLNLQLFTAKNELSKSTRKYERLARSPFGRTSSRPKKDLSDLSKTGGYTRRKKAQIR